MPDIARAQAFLADSEPVCGEQEVRAAIARLAEEIRARLEGTYPLVLAVMRGAVIFAGQLLPMLRFPLDLDYMHVTRYGTETRGGGIDWLARPREDVRGRTVLVLDDILDGGQTMSAVREELLAQGAAEFLCAVLLDKNIGRPKPITADFVGLRIEDRFVFGCGMDAKGFWRNLPEIRAMKGS